MKRFALIAVIIAFAFSMSAYAIDENEVVYTERKGKGVEKWLWNELSQYSPSDEITAGILSYFWRESQYRSDSVAGWASTLHGYGIDLCSKVTKKVDKGLDDGDSLDYFIWACQTYGGYGLGQWCAMHEITSLYDYAVGYGTSIGDARMQCAFVFYDLENNYPELWKKLKKCKDPEKAGRLIAIYYDGTVDGVQYMGYKAGRFYNKYHKEVEG